MQHIKELYEYREMIISLVRKDLRGRYKGSVLGFLWTFVNPLLQLIVYTIVFSIIMRASYEPVSYTHLYIIMQDMGLCQGLAIQHQGLMDQVLESGI